MTAQLKKTLNHSCKFYSYGLSMRDNFLLRYAFNSSLEKTRVASSLECGQSVKCRHCWLLGYHVHLNCICTQQLFDGRDAMAFEYLILTDQVPFFKKRNTL